MANEGEHGQVTASAAEVYEEFFLPALFSQFAPIIADAARLAEGHRTLDVACGTGVVTREAAARVGPGGEAIGLDINPGMLSTARARCPGAVFEEGSAEALPFDDESFDAVTCQFALMFFADRGQALREMRRVTRPGGHVAVAVWGRLEDTPGYLRMVKLLRRLFGNEAADRLYAPYNLGDRDRVAALFEGAGMPNVEVRTVVGTARFGSIRSWVHTDVRGWTLADLLDDAQFETLVAEAEKDLADLAKPDGTVEFAAPAHLVVVQRS